VLQCVAVCCSVLQCVAVCCSVLQCVAVCCSVLQCVVALYRVLESREIHISTHARTHTYTITSHWVTSYQYPTHQTNLNKRQTEGGLGVRVWRKTNTDRRLGCVVTYGSNLHTHARITHTDRVYTCMHTVCTHTDRIYTCTHSQSYLRILIASTHARTHNRKNTYWSYPWIDTINRINTYGSYLHTHAHTIIFTHADRIYTRTHTQSYQHILIASTHARTHNRINTYWSHLHTHAHTIVSTHTDRIYTRTHT